MTVMKLTDRKRRPLLSSEVKDITPGSACPCCDARQLLIREIHSRLRNEQVRIKQVYCPFCGSTGQIEITDAE